MHFHSADSGTLRIIAAKGEPLHGRHVQKDNLRWVEWPKNAVSEDALTSIEALPGRDEDEPRMALRTMEAGEPLLESDLSGSGVSGRLVAELGKGTRAFAAPVADGIGGSSIRPGDRVDVILTKTEDGHPVTKVFMRDVTVIAVDREVDLDQDQPWSGRSTATIEVTQGQVQQLLLAIRAGKLRLMLRGVRETKMGGLMRPLCRDFDPQSKTLLGRCGSAFERFRGTQTSGWRRVRARAWNSRCAESLATPYLRHSL